MNEIEGDWLLDLGNARLKMARIQGAGIAQALSWPLADVGFPEPARALLAASPIGQRAWLASSTNAARSDAACIAMTAIGLQVHMARTTSPCRRLRIAYAEPDRLGVDRFLALLAASERGDGPWLLVSVGSALTVDLLDADGRHLGGLIALSPTLHRQALAARIPHLEVSGGTATDFAVDTADALASGAQAAALGLIERSLCQARIRLGRAPTLLLSGGGGDVLHPQLGSDCVWLPSLVLDGLALYAQSSASFAT